MVDFVDCVLFFSLLSLIVYLLCHISYDRMFWTEEHDVILVREMLANSPFAAQSVGQFKEVGSGMKSQSAFCK